MDQETLFSTDSSQIPLAERERPQSLESLVGQNHILNGRFRRMLETDRWTGFVFWGPPGTGKTSLARIIANFTRRKFHLLSGVTCGVKDIREVLEASRNAFRAGQLAHILFIDEVHRLNKSQQDVLLPFLEEGSIRFIGATTENPSFEINNAIASRSVIFRFNPLTEPEILLVLKNVRKDGYEFESGVFERIAKIAGGDARRALNLLDHLCLSCTKEELITLSNLEKICEAQTLYYDKHDQAHHDTISAFIKSIRGSDPDAAVYYLARMLEGGEDPLFIARRLIILASEDIGNANPAGLMVATSAFTAVHSIGMPEARIVLSQATTYLACSEKSNRSYSAINLAQEEVRNSLSAQIPSHLRNGSNYKYPHDYPGGWVKCEYLPESLKGKRFYIPSQNGNEKKFCEFLKLRGKE
jgi:putative ATPase